VGHKCKSAVFQDSGVNYDKGWSWECKFRFVRCQDNYFFHFPGWGANKFSTWLLSDVIASDQQSARAALGQRHRGTIGHAVTRRCSRYFNQAKLRLRLLCPTWTSLHLRTPASHQPRSTMPLFWGSRRKSTTASSPSLETATPSLETPPGSLSPSSDAATRKYPETSSSSTMTSIALFLSPIKCSEMVRHLRWRHPPLPELPVRRITSRLGHHQKFDRGIQYPIRSRIK